MDGFLLKTSGSTVLRRGVSVLLVSWSKSSDQNSLVHVVLGDWMVSPGLGPVLGDAIVSSLVGLSKALGISF